MHTKHGTQKMEFVPYFVRFTITYGRVMTTRLKEAREYQQSTALWRNFEANIQLLMG